MRNVPLPFPPGAAVEARIDLRDREGRARAVDPRFNVVLEASAGTGKTRVLVDRYVNLLKAGVDPANVLAITFTRKAAAEMRDRIIGALKSAAATGELPPARWRELRDRSADIAISTIDAFCLSLLREFPLEADLDPDFSLVDEAEAPRLVDESLDRAIRICRGVAREDENVSLVFAQLGERRARVALRQLLQRRLVARRVLSECLAPSGHDAKVGDVVRQSARAFLAVFDSMRGGLAAFLDSGPLDSAFYVLRHDLRALSAVVCGGHSVDAGLLQAAMSRVREHFLTRDGSVRARLPYPKASFANLTDWRVHKELTLEYGGQIAGVIGTYRRDVNALVARGVLRMFRIAEGEYRRTLDAHCAVDYADLLMKAVELLAQMEEFSRSRYRLESRYHHVLVDECQDTSRAQWELVSLLIQSWGEGTGLAHSGPLPPSIFVVGDRKQSIYGFRDADVSVLRDAVRRIAGLRSDPDVRHSISRSFRSVSPLLAFVNDVCHEIDKADRDDAFRYGEEDRFPVTGSDEPAVRFAGDAVLGIAAGDTAESCADAVAAEIARLISSGATVRDRQTGVARTIAPGDIAILFRTRESHREYEAALARRGLPTYVYKGLGFFDADEVKDVLALVRYLADPASDLHAAAFLRSRFARLSDDALRRLAPRLSRALRADVPVSATAALDALDARTLARARASARTWCALVDRIPPAELVDRVLEESAYLMELRGSRFTQARENLKKVRALIRRLQNRGYATMGRIAAHLERLAVGDEANAAIDAVESVHLMTVHAAKGLEFPVVFVVNLAKGTGNRRDPVRIAADLADESSVAVGDFQSPGDDDRRAKEREETKRLLYVALTRARDRLYLGTVVTDGRVKPGPGSLAEVLPQSLLDLFAQPPGDQPTASWYSGMGNAHGMARIIAPEQPVADLPMPATSAAAEGDFAFLTDTSAPRTSVAAMTDVAAPARPADGRSSDRLVGTLVHRLLQRFGCGPSDADVTASVVSHLLLQHEPAVAADDLLRDAVVASVLDVHRAICARSDVRELYQTGEPLHEMPFSMRYADRWVRGTIDCVIRTADRIVVLDFKTGAPRDEHGFQIDLYRRAAERAFPGCRVEARLVYADLSPT